MSTARREIIARDFADQSYRWELQAIRDFRLGMLRQVKREDMDKIKQFGFKFIAKTVAGRREELKTFIEEHPSLMADDVPKMIKNFRLLQDIGRSATHSSARMSSESEDYEEEEVIQVRPKKKKAKSKRLPEPEPEELTSSPDYSE